MTAVLTDEPLRPGTAAEAVQLRSALSAAGFTSEPAGRRTGATGTDDGRPHAIEELPAGLDPGSPLGTLLTMWQLGQPVPRSAAGAALGVGADRLVELGLVRHAGEGRVAAEVVIARHEGLWFACDSMLLRGAEPMADNFVLPVTGSSLALAGCVPSDPVGSTLDLGTGCGIQAMLAARHSERVVGTDVNGRALCLGRFNVWLNGVGNVELRRGSLYEPVAGERFDLLVANPPFVVSPESGLLFRDGQGGADEISRDVVRQAGAALRPGGLGVVMVNWVVHEGERLFDPLRSWVDGTGVDTVVLVNSNDDGETYARRWLEMNGSNATPEDMDRWTRHYRTLGIAAIATGVIVVRRQHPDDGSPWFAHFAAPLIKGRVKADHFRQLVALQDFLHGIAADSCDPRPLLSRVLRPAEGHELCRTHVYRDGAYQASEARARLGVGFPFAGGLEAGTAELLSRCDGGGTLAEVLSSLAGERGIELDDLVRGAMPSVRNMLALGLLLPPEVPDLAASARP
jgi:SAM-dependent methyltransferase